MCWSKYWSIWPKYGGSSSESTRKGIENVDSAKNENWVETNDQRSTFERIAWSRDRREAGVRRRGGTPWGGAWSRGGEGQSPDEPDWGEDATLQTGWLLGYFMRMAPPPHTHTHNSKLQDPKCASGEQSPGKSKAREPQPRPQEKSCLPWSRAGPGESEGPMSLAPYCYLLLESHQK